MRDIFIILKSRFEGDYDYFQREYYKLQDKSFRDDYEENRMKEINGKLSYIRRQLDFFNDLLDYYE